MPAIDSTPERLRAAQLYGAKSPRAICACGHQGDGNKSQHDDEGNVAGYGRCTVAACSCRSFKFDHHTAQFEAYMAGVKEPPAKEQVA